MTASQEWLDFRRRRESLGLSRDALADRAGVYRDSIYNAETGKTKRPRNSTLALLHQALDAVELERFGPPEEPAAPVVSEVASTIRVTIDSVTIEIPTHEAETIDRVIDRVMENLARFQREADRSTNA